MSLAAVNCCSCPPLRRPGLHSRAWQLLSHTLLPFAQSQTLPLLASFLGPVIITKPWAKMPVAKAFNSLLLRSEGPTHTLIRLWPEVRKCEHRWPGVGQGSLVNLLEANLRIAQMTAEQWAKVSAGQVPERKPKSGGLRPGRLEERLWWKLAWKGGPCGWFHCMC